MFVYDKKSFLKDENFGLSFSESEKKVGLHSHEFLEMSYILSGSATHIIGDKRQALKRGNIIIVDYGTSHKVEEKSADFTSVNVLFLPEFIDKNLFNCRSFKEVLKTSQINFIYYDDYYLFSDDEGDILPLFDSMIKEFSAQKNGSREYIRCLVIMVIIKLMRKCEKAAELRETDKDFDQITQYIKQHYSEEITLAKLAKIFNRSAASIHQLFPKNLNTKYADFLADIRVAAACEMLKNSDKQIDEIAAAVGYKDAGSFRNIFKERVGLTPKTYAKKIN